MIITCDDILETSMKWFSLHGTFWNWDAVSFYLLLNSCFLADVWVILELNYWIYAQIIEPLHVHCSKAGKVWDPSEIHSRPRAMVARYWTCYWCIQVKAQEHWPALQEWDWYDVFFVEPVTVVWNLIPGEFQTLRVGRRHVVPVFANWCKGKKVSGACAI